MSINQPVLVLNANYEPINVCTIKRAVGLMMSGKAEVVANANGFISTTSHNYPLPSILRLSRMVHRPRQRVKLVKREIFRRDNYTCQYCGKQHDLTIDHVLPRHRGGTHSWQNLVTACSTCNRKKGGRTPLEANMMLRSIPREPRPSAEYLFGRMIDDRVEWGQYINGW